MRTLVLDFPEKDRVCWHVLGGSNGGVTGCREHHDEEVGSVGIENIMVGIEIVSEETLRYPARV
jgi:hypothetical protein